MIMRYEVRGTLLSSTCEVNEYFKRVVHQFEFLSITPQAFANSSPVGWSAATTLGQHEDLLST